jgi:hypothetical protein
VARIARKPAQSRRVAFGAIASLLKVAVLMVGKDYIGIAIAVDN